MHVLDHTAGDLDGEAYGRLSPFHQAPVIDDDGFVVSESGAILLYLAEKAGRLLPTDVEGRTRVLQWSFAAVFTVAPSVVSRDMASIFDEAKAAPTLHAEVDKIIGRFLAGVEQRLDGRTWIACDGFTVADILMAGVLRMIRKTELTEPFPRLRAYAARCVARPAWQRTLASAAERLGVAVDDIR